MKKNGQTHWFLSSSCCGTLSFLGLLQEKGGKAFFYLKRKLQKKECELYTKKARL
ncbi:hypothetical protein CLV24_112107 [Pontibacter ummariensis]|uniref:Uncharacterized protein n=1 Tax=Pontibacter ummariensis TaxID=1610492 RepID=A0A239GYA3_9BACT|nr:hypothetical protein CLV24_112107 [Pontibacter ummariensis]SNS73778.1 hypothetical protein SAMN06296052_11271 [Pontibacter ummariensis]